MFTMPIWATLFVLLWIGDRPSSGGLVALLLGIVFAREQTLQSTSSLRIDGSLLG